MNVWTRHKMLGPSQLIPRSIVPSDTKASDPSQLGNIMTTSTTTPTRAPICSASGANPLRSSMSNLLPDPLRPQRQDGGGLNNSSACGQGAHPAVSIRSVRSQERRHASATSGPRVSSRPLLHPRGTRTAGRKLIQSQDSRCFRENLLHHPGPSSSRSFQQRASLDCPELSLECRIICS